MTTGTGAPVMARAERGPIRRTIMFGLGGLFVLGLIGLTSITVVQTVESASVSDGSLASYRLLQHVGAEEAALGDARATVLAAMLDPTPAAIEAVHAAAAALRDTWRDIDADVGADAGLHGSFTTGLVAIDTWSQQWAEPVANALSAGSPIAARADLSVAAGDTLFSVARNGLAGFRAAAADRLTSMLHGYRDRSAIVIFILVVASIVLESCVLLIGAWIIRVVIGPLRRLNDAAIGQLRGDSVEFRPERDDEIGALASMLERLRLALEGRYREAQRASTRAATLNKLGDLISFSAEEFEVIDATVRTLERLVPTRRGDIQLVNASRSRLMYSGSWGPRQPGLETPVPVDRVDRCPAIRRSAPFVVPDVTDNLAVLCAAHPIEQGSLACIPLMAMGRPIGVIHLEADSPISDDVVADAGRIAEQVAVAIANARLMKTMESLAMTDGLTGLRNARFFDTYLEQELAAADRDREPLTVLMIDIDHFKRFNDSYGHPGGDEALRVFGRVVRSALRGSDLAARYGGEEFVVALRHTDLAGAAVVAEKIRAAVASAVVELGAGRYGRITVSIGVAEADLTTIDQKRLLASADAALYRAKSTGRDKVVVASVVDGTGDPIKDGDETTAEPPGRTEEQPARMTEQVVPIRRRRRPRPTEGDRVDALAGGHGTAARA